MMGISMLGDFVSVYPGLQNRYCRRGKGTIERETRQDARFLAKFRQCGVLVLKMNRYERRQKNARIRRVFSCRFFLDSRKTIWNNLKHAERLV